MEEKSINKEVQEKEPNFFLFLLGTLGQVILIIFLVTASFYGIVSFTRHHTTCDVVMNNVQKEMSYDELIKNFGEYKLYGLIAVIDLTQFEENNELFVNKIDYSIECKLKIEQ